MGCGSKGSSRFHFSHMDGGRKWALIVAGTDEPAPESFVLLLDFDAVVGAVDKLEEIEGVIESC